MKDMQTKIKTIGVLTSGGDAPGMNAAVRAVVRTGVYHGVRVMGIKRGYLGLINGDIVELEARSVSEILQKGGTELMTARCMEFKEKAGVLKAYEVAKVFGLDGLVVIGGDGSFRGAKDLCEAGLPTVAVPGTIDNDIACSEYTIGFDTCLNTVVDAVDKLRDTASSHDRCSVIEVMGRNAGYIAAHAAVACGAEVVLVPEHEWNFDDDVIRPILEGKARGKKHSIVIVAEGVGGALEIANEIKKKTGIDARTTILGHVQRGGRPTVRDRVTASLMGNYAAELLINGKSNRIVRVYDGKIDDIDIQEGLAMTKSLDKNILDVANKLSV